MSISRFALKIADDAWRAICRRPSRGDEERYALLVMEIGEAYAVFVASGEPWPTHIPGDGVVYDGGTGPQAAGWDNLPKGRFLLATKEDSQGNAVTAFLLVRATDGTFEWRFATVHFCDSEFAFQGVWMLDSSGPCRSLYGKLEVNDAIQPNMKEAYAFITDALQGWLGKSK